MPVQQVARAQAAHREARGKQRRPAAAAKAAAAAINLRQQRPEAARLGKSAAPRRVPATRLFHLQPLGRRRPAATWVTLLCSTLPAPRQSMSHTHITKQKKSKVGTSGVSRRDTVIVRRPQPTT